MGDQCSDPGEPRRPDPFQRKPEYPVDRKECWQRWNYRLEGTGALTSKRSATLRPRKSLSAAMKWRRASASVLLLVSAYVCEMNVPLQFGHWPRRSLKVLTCAKYLAWHASHSYSTARMSPGEMKVRCSSVIVARVLPLDCISKVERGRFFLLNLSKVCRRKIVTQFTLLTTNP